MYPEIKQNIKVTERQNITLMGIDTSNKYPDGSFKMCSNITTDEFPYIKTRNRLINIYANDRPLGMDLFVWNDMLRIDKQTTQVWYGDTSLGRLTSISTTERAKKFPKQYAVSGNRLCIFPDKVYIDLDETVLKLRKMGRELFYVSDKPHHFYNNANNICAISIPEKSVTDFTKELTVSPGDKLFISGCPSADDEKEYEISSIQPHLIYLKGQWTKTGTTAANKLDSEYRIQRWSEYIEGESRVIPDLDFVCMKDNKIYGCSSKYQTIYVSSQGDPLDFGTYEGVATDAYAVAVGTPGEFTGIAQVGSSVCFFKEERVHKLMGAYPAEYYLYQYDTAGVKAGFSGSVQTVEGSAFYFSNFGFTRFTSSEAVIVSEALNNVGIENVDSDYDGKNYWLSSNKGVFVYDMQYHIWTRHYDYESFGIVHKGPIHYISTKHDIKMAGYDDQVLPYEWSIEFNPFRERSSSTSFIFNKKRYVKFIFDMDLPYGSSFLIEASEDGGPFKEKKYLLGEKKGNVSVTISTNRVDHLALKISGHGPMTIYAMEREFLTSGSER